MPTNNVKSIKSRHNAGEKLEYEVFYGHLPSPTGKLTSTCFSLWWMSPFTINQTSYCCVEQYISAEKAKSLKDYKSLKIIMETTNPLVMKSRVSSPKSIAKFGETLNLSRLLYQGNLAKFSQNRDLANFLLSTGDKVLVYASPSDSVLGIRMKSTDPGCSNPNNWRNENLLGFVLMDVRDTLRENPMTYKEIL